MSCFSPIHAWRATPRADGKATIVFKRSEGNGIGSEINLPCGQCIGCRLERSRQWAVRCVHESKLYSDNCFLTLTYNDSNLPWDGSLDVRDFQLFMKRLRKYFTGKSIRFFHCGEYGERLGRPHYHALLFNLDFVDKVLYSENDGFPIYESKVLDKLWGLGKCWIGDLTFESAAYVARYVTKKITGDMALEHYVNKDTGCVLRPEYVTMSRRPGIGRGWYDKFKTDVFPSDEVISRGVSCKPPRFYDEVLKSQAEDLYKSVKARRVAVGRRLDPMEQFGDRLRVKEIVKKAQVGSLRRKLESE